MEIYGGGRRRDTQAAGGWSAATGGGEGGAGGGGAGQYYSPSDTPSFVLCPYPQNELPGALQKFQVPFFFPWKVGFWTFILFFVVLFLSVPAQLRSVLERYKCCFLLLLQPLELPPLRGEFEQTLCLRAMKISMVLACCNISKCIQHRSRGTSFVFLHCYSFLLSLRGEFMQTLCLRVMRIGVVLACCCMLKYIQHHNFPCPHWYSYSYGLIRMISWTRECRYISSLEMLPVSLVVVLPAM